MGHGFPYLYITEGVRVWFVDPDRATLGRACERRELTCNLFRELVALISNTATGIRDSCAASQGLSLTPSRHSYISVCDQYRVLFVE